MEGGWGGAGGKAAPASISKDAHSSSSGKDRFPKLFSRAIVRWQNQGEEDKRGCLNSSAQCTPQRTSALARDGVAVVLSCWSRTSPQPAANSREVVAGGTQFGLRLLAWGLGAS